MVVEAAAGYGKSVLAAELVDAWGSVGIEVLLEEGGVSAQLLTGRLLAAVARAGFPEAAAAASASGEDAPAVVDALMAGLANESCTIVVDDAHHAQLDAGRLIDRIATRVDGGQRLVVLARSLPSGAERIRRAEAVQLTAADLALRPEESLQLCSSGFGLDVDNTQARVLHDATGGWTAATVLAASRAKRTGEAVELVARAAAGDPAGAVASILAEAITTMGTDRATLALLGRLPLLDAELVDEVEGRAGLFDRALRAGLPLTRGRGAWWDLPGPVRDHFVALDDVAPGLLRLAGEIYERRGELGAALQLLLAAGDFEAAAALAASAAPRHIEAIDVLELRSVVDRLPKELLDRYPHALLHLARSCESATLIDRRRGLLAHVGAIVDAHPDPSLRRALEVEIASDLMRENRVVDAEHVAHQVLEEAPASETLTRARALSVIGRATSWHLDDTGRQEESSLREAASYLAQATELYLDLGLRSAAAGLAPYRAIWTEFACGRASVALELLNSALSLVVDRPRRWAYVLQHRAEVLTELGRFDECATDIEETFRVASRLGNAEQLFAYGHWQLAIVASMRGDPAATVEHARIVEMYRGDWWDIACADFLADAADCLDRVGEVALAQEYLERAKSDPKDAAAIIAMAEGALLARHGDPLRAEACLAIAPNQGIAPREYWRATLLRALAAFRRGDRIAGALAARAFEEASRLGQAQLPLIREREVTESLLALAAETGQPAALALETGSLPIALTVLGQFELTRGGRPVPIGIGQGPQLLKLVAVNGGRVVAEQAIEALWPGSDRESGRNRLRTVLNRLRESAGEVIVRAGELLVLAPEIGVDLNRFHTEARRALALGLAEPPLAVALARSAISRYRGDLLPDDPYAAWAEQPRERARQVMLDLLDLCASAAAKSGDLDEARRVVERTIELAPYDDERYLKAASLLLEQGRRGAALAVVRRAQAALADLGLAPPGSLANMERSIGA